MSTNVRVKKLTVSSKAEPGRSDVYHDVFDGDVKTGKLISSTLVGKLRKIRGVAGYDAFVMNTDGSRSGLGNFGTRSGAGHAARKSFMEANGLAKAPKATKTVIATPDISDEQEKFLKREARNKRRREQRAAKKAA